MAKDEPDIKKLYYSIGEVSEITDLKQYVLRYWETEFSELRPRKNRAGNRTYRQSDIDTVLRIKDLLYNQKYTIEGARQRLRLEGGASPESGPAPNEEKYRNILKSVKRELHDILEILSK